MALIPITSFYLYPTSRLEMFKAGLALIPGARVQCNPNLPAAWRDIKTLCQP